MRKFLGAVLTMMIMGGQSVSAYDYSSFNSKFNASDYREALNMGLKFFGGQRCGDNSNWMLVNNPNVTKKYCHLKDGQGKVNGGANGSYDLTGGWHDCGDHIKVCVTMGYAATSLLIAYDIWPNAFQDNYDAKYGTSNNVPDVLDEAKIATDYFIKCFPDNNTFVYYVGDGTDHNCWVTSSKQSDMGTNQGGDPRPVWTSTTLGGPQAANFASSLALMAMHYPDQAYSKKCYDAALVAYDYASKHPTANVTIPEFYTAVNTECSDELALASILLYRMTGDVSYKTKALSFLQGKWESNSPLAWDTMSDFTYYYILKEDPTASNGSGGRFADHLYKNVFGLHITKGKSDSNGFPYYISKWGSNKLACGGAVAAALYCKLADDGVISPTGDVEEARNFNRRIVDYVLGDNEFNHTFLHGYKGDMTFRIHHRNAMGRNDNPGSSVKNTADYMFASGGVIGGPTGTGNFANIIEGGDNFKQTEGGCDYNAPFVAAIANLVADMDPVDVMETRSSEDSKFNVYPSNFDDYLIVEPIEIDYSGDAMVSVVSATGNVVYKQKLTNYGSVIFNTSSLSAGVYLVKIDFEGGYKTFKVVKY